MLIRTKYGVIIIENNRCFFCGKPPKKEDLVSFITHDMCKKCDEQRAKFVKRSERAQDYWKNRHKKKYYFVCPLCMEPVHEHDHLFFAIRDVCRECDRDEFRKQVGWVQ